MFANNMKTKNKHIITRCKASENWTKVSFKPDLLKFGMSKLEDDVVALMKRRVLDLAAFLGESVKVELNGEEVPVNSFAKYVDLYQNSPSTPHQDSITRVVHKTDRWEVICLCRRHATYEQVSFVNGVATTSGGTHVKYITDQIVGHVVGTAQSEQNNPNVLFHVNDELVRSQFWIFVNALIDNPVFSSQTKEYLSSSPSSFGSTCKLPEDLLKKVSQSIVNTVLSLAEYKHNKEVEESNEAKSKRITDISRLEDAIEAGGSNSEKCTLILVHGDADKALAMAGISVLGWERYGVFQLKEDLLDLKDPDQISSEVNKEIDTISKFLGLKDVEYENASELRYGRLMIMTDQDLDGFHIKGLLINFINALWPSLLKIPFFLVEFKMPIIKAISKHGTLLSFYSMTDYQSWKKILDRKSSGWSLKYYKGLGTNTSMEGKKYFKYLEKHTKAFVMVDKKDTDAITLAFSSKKEHLKKNWLQKFKPGSHNPNQDKEWVKYRDFINREVIQYYAADIQNSIPSMVDGLKPGQRKILFCCFKRNLVKEAKVDQLSGYVIEHSAYHHDKEGPAKEIIRMAQDYVGSSNNINLLQPKGQFGTRLQGGNDHASERYIFTCLSPITRLLFPEDDDILLDYLDEQGQSVEPSWYMPIIPMVLVNGSKGTGGGWSSDIPNHNPRDIIANLRHLLNDEPMQSMGPWYKGFKGCIVKITNANYLSSGIIEEVNTTTLRITELPIGKSVQDYKEFLQSLKTNNGLEPFIEDFRRYGDDTTVHFEVTLSEDKLKAAKQEGLLTKFKLKSELHTSNMHLFNPNGVLKKYETPEKIIEEFFNLRLQYYEKRKEVLCGVLELEMLRLENMIGFIQEVIKGEIVVFNRKRADLILQLKQKGFAPLPKKRDTVEALAPKETKKSEGSDYDYLLAMAIEAFTVEKVQELYTSKMKLSDQLKDLKSATPKSLWLKDLCALENELNVQEKKTNSCEKEAEPSTPSTTSAIGTGSAKPYGSAPTKEAPYSLDSSDNEETETHGSSNKSSKMQKKNKKMKKSSCVDISEDEEDDCVIELVQPIKEEPTEDKDNIGNSEIKDNTEGRSENFEAKVEPTEFGTIEVYRESAYTGMENNPTATTRKREMVEQQHQLVPSQERIAEIISRDESVGMSPEKKVQKTSPLPFSKKRSSPISSNEI